MVRCLHSDESGNIRRCNLVGVYWEGGVPGHVHCIAAFVMLSRTTSLITILVSLWLGVLTVVLVYMLSSGNFESISRLQPVVRHAGFAAVPDSTAEEEEEKTLSTNINHATVIKELSRPNIKRNSLKHVILLSHLLPPIENISRITTPSRETFLNYIAPVGLPVIFSDMLLGTKLEGWSWEMVKQRWGDHIFHNTRQGNYSNKVNKFGKHHIKRVSIRLSRFVDLVTGVSQPNEHEKSLYITKQKVLPPQALDEEFYYPPFYPGNHQRCFLEPTGW